MAGTVTSLEDSFKVPQVISFQSGVALWIDFINGRDKNQVCAGFCEHFNIFFKADGVFLKIAAVIELGRIYKNAAYGEICQGAAGFNQVQMPLVQSTPSGHK